MRDAQGAIGLMTLLTYGERKEKKERKRRKKRVHRRGQIITSLVPSLFFSLLFFPRSEIMTNAESPANGWLEIGLFLASGLLTC